MLIDQVKFSHCFAAVVASGGFMGAVKELLKYTALHFGLFSA